MPRFPSIRIPIVLTAAAGLVALGLTYGGSLIVAVVAGLLVLGVALLAVRTPRGEMLEDAPANPERRRFIGLVGGLGLAFLAGGALAGRALRRITTPNPRPALERMARALGAENLELLRRQYVPGRSGDLQLLLAPFNSSNYSEESLSLVRNDPRSSHASIWMYLERVPIAVYAPGIIEPSDSTERATLADLAPTAAHLMGFDGFRAPDGRVLPGIERPATPPRVIVTFVIDGGGWNALQLWDHPDPAKSAWPNLKRLMRASATYRNATVGTFPAVTACAHAMIGTGAFPRTNGISGHNLRMNGHPVKAYGEAGKADPGFLLAPTLAEVYNEHTGDGAWVGELGYQIWHIGMLGRGGDRPLGDLPVAVYWDEDGGGGWHPQNPDLYRMPRSYPGVERLAEREAEYHGPPPSSFDPEGKKAPCCFPPIIRYQGDLIESTITSEPVGEGPNTSLLYINFKAPDYAGHVYNFTALQERFALAAVDEQLGRLVDQLEQRFAPGEFALIVTADHGQCPTVNLAGGVRLDPIQIEEDLEGEFGRSPLKLVESVVPHEIYLSNESMLDAGVTAEDIAAWLEDYRYGDNIGPYVPEQAIDRDRLDERIFAAVMPTSFIERLGDADLATYGEGEFGGRPDVDPGIPPVSW